MRRFLLIWTGQFISILGSGLTSFGLAVFVFERTGQATAFAVYALLDSLPRVLLAPAAGVLIDRWSRRWVMAAADTGNALVTLAAAALYLTGRLDVGAVYLIVLAGSICSAFQEPAYSAAIPQLVPSAQLVRANSLVQFSQSTALLAAPLLAGWLFGQIGLGGLMLIDFATYFFAVGALLAVAIPQPQAEPRGAQRRSLWAEAGLGWPYLLARPGLLHLIGYFAGVNLLLNGVLVLTGPLVLSFADATALGLVYSIAGVGTLLGSFLLSVWGGPRRRVAGILGGVALSALGLLVVGLRPALPSVGAGYFILLFAVPMGSSLVLALFQSKVEPAMLGRVLALRTMLGRSTMPVGYLLGGWLADYVFEPAMRVGGALAGGPAGAVLGVGRGRGLGLMFALAGLGVLVLTLAAAADPRLRHVEREVPDAAPEPAAAG